MGELVVYNKPELRRPYLVVGMAGWPNAGEVGTGAVGYLRDRLEATKFAEVTPEEFYDFSSQRPLVIVEGGIIRWLRFAANELFYWQNPQGEHDLILLMGTEPHLRWGKYLGILLQLAKQFQVQRVYCVGGVYDRIPHTRQPPVTAVVNYARLKKELASLEVGWTDYQGPSSFHSSFLVACREQGIEAVSLWGHAPIYIQAIRNPRVCHAVLSRLVRLLGVEVDLGELLKAAEHMEEALARLLTQNEELRDYISQFEKEYEEQQRERRTEPLKGVERLFKQIEEFLKREAKRGEESGG